MTTPLDDLTQYSALPLDVMAAISNQDLEDEEGGSAEYLAGAELRLLLPKTSIGSVIGKGGEVISSIRATSGARINILEPSLAMEERIVVVKGGPKEVVQAADLIVECVECKLASLPALSPALFLVRVPVTNDQAGAVIGNAGDVISSLRAQSEARIDMSKKNSAPADMPWLALHNKIRIITVSGQVACVRKAVVLLADILVMHPSANPNALVAFDQSNYNRPGVPLSPSLLPTPHSYYQSHSASQQSSGMYASSRGGVFNDALIPYDVMMTVSFPVPASSVGSIIGKRGAVINDIRRSTGCKIEISNSNDDSMSRVVTITGTQSAVERAKVFIQRSLMDAQAVQ